MPTPPGPSIAPTTSPGDDGARLIEALAQGGVALKDVAGLTPADMDAIAKVGASAIQSGRFELAVRVFSSLAALDPGEPLHLLHCAFAHKGAGQRDLAIEQLGRFLDADVPKALPDVARALLLRAELHGAGNRAAAAADLLAARALAARSPEVKQIVDGGAP
ncbi:MAG: hypothetical protein HYS27_11690 [Deltaproteobacteria bacterium]|nr:hypothetical protein [Deltaproteobacteria bacterium]